MVSKPRSPEYLSHLGFLGGLRVLLEPPDRSVLTSWALPTGLVAQPESSRLGTLRVSYRLLPAVSEIEVSREGNGGHSRITSGTGIAWGLHIPGGVGNGSASVRS